MNILRINNCNTDFRGRVLIVGKGWNDKIKTTFVENPRIMYFAEKDFDIIGRLKVKKVRRENLIGSSNEIVYRFDLMVGKSKYAIVNKIKASLGLLPKLKLIKDYHNENNFINILINRLNSDKLKLNSDLNFVYHRISSKAYNLD